MERIITPIYCKNGMLNGWVEVKPVELKEKPKDKGFHKLLEEKQEELKNDGTVLAELLGPGESEE